MERTGTRFTTALAVAAALLAAPACQQKGREGQQQSSSEPRTTTTTTSQQEGSQAQAGSDQARRREVSGRVVRADDREIVLRQEGGKPDLRLTVSGETRVTVQGQRGSPADLQEGTQVRAAYDESGGEPRALEIEAQGNAPGR